MDAAWKRQRGKCPICRKPLDRSKPSGCQIEHNHKIKDRRKAFRGLACWWCNMKVLAPMERAGKHRVLAAIFYLWGREGHDVA